MTQHTIEHEGREIVVLIEADVEPGGPGNRLHPAYGPQVSFERVETEDGAELSDNLFRRFEDDLRSAVLSR